jgi:acyl carrier protein
MNADESRTLVLALILDIAPEADADSLAADADADLRRAADLDSLDFQTLVEGVAAATHVDIPEIDYPQVRSLRGLSEYVAAHST